jgi:hypothetical protein
MKTTNNSVSQGNSSMDRREFIRGVAAGATLAAAGLGNVRAATDAGEGAATPTAAGAPFVAIQMSPHSMLDEGIEKCLDLVQETAAVNCLMVYSHAYGGNMRKPARILANDHGVPARDNTQRKLPVVWVKTHDEFYKNTTLRHQKVDDAFVYAKNDLFAELVEPCRKRGIKLYARILEGDGRTIANFQQSVTQDINGRATGTACWNNPNCKNFWVDTAADLFSNYELDGFQWGAERSGPLMNTILPWNNEPPSCFCEYCRTRAKTKGIDADRARQGYSDLYDLVRGVAANKPRPADGTFTAFLRVLLRYPEVLAWEYQYRMSREEVLQAMYAKIKSIKPSAQVGWHIDHEPSSWDLVARAEWTYEEMAPYSDYIKFIAYHAVLGPRIHDWYLERFKRSVLADLSLEQSLDLYYTLFNYDKNAEPSVGDLSKKGMSAEYVESETKHSVASANGKTKMYTGIGFDVPASPPDDPEVIYQATLKSFQAGAAGVVISREYEEMRVPNLQAVGRAARQVAKA